MRWFLLALLCVAPLVARPQRMQVEGVVITLDADHIQYDGNAHRAYLVGHAVMIADQSVFRADNIVVDFSRAQRPAATATGHVVLEDATRGRITGDRLRYDFAVRRGEMHDAEVTVPLNYRPAMRDLLRPEEAPTELRIDAVEATQLTGRIQFRQAGVTHSPLVPPEFQLRASGLTVFTDGSSLHQGIDRVQAHGVKLQIHGHTVLGLPDIDVGDGGLVFPRIGNNGTDGIYIEQPFSPFSLRPARLVITPRLGTGSGVTGNARFAIGSSPGTFEIIAGYKERRLLFRTRQPVQVSRLPEFAWRWQTTQAPSVGGTVRSRFSYGQYQEILNTTAWRGTFEADWRHALYDGVATRLAYDVGGLYSFYSTGAEYGWLRGGVTLDHRFGYRFYLGATLRSHWIVGRTPFRFDQIEVPTDVTTAARLRLSRHWLIGSTLQYDINHGEVMRHDVSLDYRDRLVEYGLNVLLKPRVEVQADLKVLGF